ncbi:MAG: amino acid ABC transporter permease [Spirochaetaceae bacterium]|jgi:putative glutamine transport system permease protein|nr:amino acid ABC transporter permease [Spirochaetaceae bacterium]
MGGPFALDRWLLLFSDFSVFAQGFGITLLVSLFALLLALFSGVIFGLFSMTAFGLPKAVSRVYVEFFQNTPLVIQIFFLYNALPYTGIKLDLITIGVVGVGLYHGAYVAEVVRAGILSIPKGQLEAANSQGFSYIQSMAYIILPQTTVIILPPLANQAVNLIKNTSVLALVAGGDLMYRADSWASNGSLSYGPAYIVTGALYFILCFPLTRWARRFEERLKTREHLIVPKEAAEEGAGE